MQIFTELCHVLDPAHDLEVVRETDLVDRDLLVREGGLDHAPAVDHHADNVDHGLLLLAGRGDRAPDHHHPTGK